MSDTSTLERTDLNKVDITKGQCINTVSNQWASRPDDQKFTSLSALREQVAAWAEASKPHNIDPRGFEATSDADGLLIQHADLPVLGTRPTNYGFSDVCSLVGAPSRYLAKLPAELAANNLNHGFSLLDPKEVQAYVGHRLAPNGGNTMRCLTSTAYGRIYDRDVVDEVMKFAGDGVGDTRWKVPGVMSWADMRYNPNVDIDKQTTTLFASDRDVFLFLVDDKNPIEVGKTANGDPDVVFRGFYTWNSEVGDRTFGLATMYLRGVCCNRLLWGVEGFTETTFRHSSGAPKRFMGECAPALQSYAETSASKLVAGVGAAKSAIVISGANEDERNASRVDFLRKMGFSAAKALDLITTHIVEEGRPPESVWDFAQAMTAVARQCQFQDQRVKLEQSAGKLLDKVKVPA
jgi:hypothetical protein